MSTKRFRLATLGCRTNQYETQAYRDQLIQLGYQEAEEGEEADLCIVNTCTVTESADRSSRHQIRQLVRKNEGAQVVVTGCLAERRPDLVQQIGGVSAVVPNKEKEQLVASLFPEEEVPEFSIKHFEAHTRAFVKVQDGCNSFCTYCIIPYVRGRSRSRTIGAVVKEVEGLVASGYQDIVITGINVGDFEDKGRGLADLIREVDKVEGVKRLRLSSIDPDEVDEPLMDAILNGKNTCHSLHIVLQSGSNVVLKRMNRKYTRQIFFDTVEKLRAASPDFTFTTDIIVGFPGETEADFEETLDVMRSVQFAKVHMFPFSRRERTRAALYPNQVPQHVIDERKAALLQLAEKQAYALREQYVGRRLSVLTEDKRGGHTENFLMVLLPEESTEPNQLVDVRLIKNTPEGLIGAYD
ncbi:MAG: Threonylcarbamoyladenosine tRNA methylthiotransferase MtaB [Chlamydiales bacterium]|nr:Threonylcarbamoyladenosine tRNA methylthiotransferase MtaB [Chlamydiales bacterium]